ncbi:MAG TPA: sulfurtransferase, partial [Methylomirabilota bacterium]|nr:sulfurtransferase [Methylomirabilota bacterium]
MRDPDALISTDDLAARLGRPDLRVYDCTTYLEPPAPGSDDPYTVVSGRQTFVAGHV